MFILLLYKIINSLWERRCLKLQDYGSELSMQKLSEGLTWHLTMPHNLISVLLSSCFHSKSHRHARLIPRIFKVYYFPYLDPHEPLCISPGPECGGRRSCFTRPKDRTLDGKGIELHFSVQVNHVSSTNRCQSSQEDFRKRYYGFRPRSIFFTEPLCHSYNKVCGEIRLRMPIPEQSPNGLE